MEQCTGPPIFLENNASDSGLSWRISCLVFADGDRGVSHSFSEKYPTEPSISMAINRFNSRAYSIGNSLMSGARNPLTIMFEASVQRGLGTSDKNMVFRNFCDGCFVGDRDIIFVDLHGWVGVGCRSRARRRYHRLLENGFFLRLSDL